MEAHIASKRLLLVEDEAMIALAESMTLKRNGFDVTAVHSGENAVAMAKSDPSIDLVLMDIDLGCGMDGTQAAEIILRERNLPVLFLSSHTEPEVVRKTEKISSYGYVAKNSGETVLVASINMAFKLQAAMHDLANTNKELLRSREEARYNETRFKLAFMTNPDSININRLEDGMYVDINEGFTRLTGYTREDAIGKTSLEIDLWCDPDDRRELVRGLKAKGCYDNLESRFRRKNGSIGIGLMSARIIDLHGVPHIISITRDITDRIDEERTLGKLVLSAERLLSMDAGAPDYQLLVDGALDIAGAKYAVFNIYDRQGADTTLVAMAGVSEQIRKAGSIFGFELVGSHWPHDPAWAGKIKSSLLTRFETLSELAAGVVPAPVLSAIQKIFSIGELVVLKISQDERLLGNITLIMGAGERVKHEKMLEIYARQVGLLLTRRLAENALRSVQESTRLLAENIKDMLWILNLESGKWSYISPAVESIRGYSVEEAMKQALADMLTTESFAYAEARIAERSRLFLSGASGEHSYIDEIEQTRKDGSTVWTEVVTRFVRMETGEPVIVGVSRKIPGPRREPAK